MNVREVRNQTNEAKNEVLSYQFCVKLVSTVEVGEQSLEVSGIVIPEADQRLSIEQFIAFAIGTWMAGYPDVKIPDSVYLIGHFTRADLPAFDEFQNDIREITSNVRNTFVSIDSHLKLRIEDPISERGSILKVRIRDTLLLAPANAKSLGDIGDIVGFQKIRLADDVRQEISIKENMKILRADNWLLFRDYAIRDAEVCVRYAERILRQHYDLFADFRLPVTLTSFGTKLVFQDWQAEGLDPDRVLGRETGVEKTFVKKLGYSVKKERKPFLDDVFWQLDFVTAAYHGGRNEQFIYGVPDEGDWRDLDISSAYTTAMSMIGLPDWTTIEQVYDIDSIRFDELAFCSVDFEFPQHVQYPTLPVRTQNGIIFPRSGTSVCPAPEIWLARELGAILKLRVGKRVTVDRSRPIFKNFIKGSIQKRNQHQKGSLENLFWKEVGNSTYGKTAQGMRKKRVYDLKADDMVELPESRLPQPFFCRVHHLVHQGTARRDPQRVAHRRQSVQRHDRRVPVDGSTVRHRRCDGKAACPGVQESTQ